MRGKPKREAQNRRGPSLTSEVKHIVTAICKYLEMELTHCNYREHNKDSWMYSM